TILLFLPYMYKSDITSSSLIKGKSKLPAIKDEILSEMSSGRIIVIWRSKLDIKICINSIIQIIIFIGVIDWKTVRKMSTIDHTKIVHLIVHGQHDLIGTVKHKLTSLGFTENNLVPASPKKMAILVIMLRWHGPQCVRLK